MVFTFCTGTVVEDFFVVVVLLFIFFLSGILGQKLNPFMSKAKFDLNETRMHGYVLNQIFSNACHLGLRKKKTCS